MQSYNFLIPFYLTFFLKGILSPITIFEYAKEACSLATVPCFSPSEMIKRKMDFSRNSRDSVCLISGNRKKIRCLKTGNWKRILLSTQSTGK